MYYPSTNNSVDASAPNFATTGDSIPTALNESTYGSGQQQRAENLYAETTFVCPAYWMAEAFPTSFKYQYSVPGALHGSDAVAVFGPPTPNLSDDFVRAVMTIWGNFVTSDDPSIDASIANGANASTSTDNSAVTAFPAFSVAQPLQINLNQTQGTFYSAENDAIPGGPNITQSQQPGLSNDFTAVNAYTWEGGRGQRCDFWRSVASLVPE